MSLPEAFRPFVEGAPCAVMARLSVEYLLDDQTLSLLFAEHADRQYERQQTLTHLVDVMLDVACGIQGSPRLAFQARSEEIAASLSAFYGKLNRTELGISAAVVAHSAQKARTVIQAMRGLDSEPVPGFASYVLDGNMLAGTDHRLKPLRPLRNRNRQRTGDPRDWCRGAIFPLAEDHASPGHTHPRRRNGNRAHHQPAAPSPGPNDRHGLSSAMDHRKAFPAAHRLAALRAAHAGLSAGGVVCICHVAGGG